MFDLLTTLIGGRAGASLRRFARLAAFALVVLVFALIALAAGSVAVFLALDETMGPERAALVVAGGALVIALLASIPLWLKPRPPPSTTASTMVEVAVAIGLALLTGRRSKGR